MKVEKPGQLIYRWDNKNIIATIRLKECSVFNKKIFCIKLDELNEATWK